MKISTCGMKAFSWIWVQIVSQYVSVAVFDPSLQVADRCLSVSVAIKPLKTRHDFTAESKLFRVDC